MRIRFTPYKDFWIRVGVSLLVAVFFVFLGAESVMGVIHSGQFVYDLIASFVLAFILGSYIRLLSIRLDKKYPWNKTTVIRMIYQAVAGVVLPSLFTLAYIYVYMMIIMGLSKEDVVFFHAEFPIAVLLIIFWNIVYAGHFFWQEKKKQNPDAG
jgi:uncharacterized membrane protein YbhN (UPF0104 family)